LRRHPQDLQQLDLYRQALAQIALLGLNLVVVTEQHIAQAGDVSHQHGLPTNDAILIVVMQSRGLTRLASNDADFDRISGITRYAPL
jgi:predicted nucleic acid-binding protein